MLRVAGVVGGKREKKGVAEEEQFSPKHFSTEHEHMLQRKIKGWQLKASFHYNFCPLTVLSCVINTCIKLVFATITEGCSCFLLAISVHGH